MRWMVPVLAVLGTGCQLLFSPDTGQGGDDGPDPGVPSATVRFDDVIAVDGLPVPIRLDGEVLDLSAVERPKEQLRFVGSAGDWPFEIERWDADGESVVWVLPQSLAAGPNDTVTLYYGPGAGGVADAAAVWGSGYAAVWHMSDEPMPGTVLDSAGVYTGTADGETLRGGAIGGARQFGAGAAGAVTFPGGEALFDGWSELTFELFVWPEVNGRWCDQGEPIYTATVSGEPNENHLDITFDFECEGEQECYTDPTLPLDALDWTHVAYAYDGAQMTWYRNGQLVEVDDGLGPRLLASDEAFELGSSEETTFGGALDEVRISTVYRDAAYAAAVYATGDPAFVDVTPNPE